MRPKASEAARSGEAGRGSGRAVALARVRRFARLLDAAVGIPGTRVRFGLDALLGLVPGAGDVAGAALAALVVLAGVRLGAPWPVLGRMVLNLLVDAALGLVPLLGDLADVGWKANLRNVDLLEAHVRAPDPTRRRSVLTLAGVGAGLAGLVVALAAAVYVLVRALLGMI